MNNRGWLDRMSVRNLPVEFLIGPCCLYHQLPPWETEIVIFLMLMDEAQLKVLLITFWMQTAIDHSRAKPWVHSTSTKMFILFRHYSFRQFTPQCTVLNIFTSGWHSQLQHRWCCRPDSQKKTAFAVGFVYAQGKAVCAFKIQLAQRRDSCKSYLCTSQLMVPRLLSELTSPGSEIKQS